MEKDYTFMALPEPKRQASLLAVLSSWRLGSVTLHQFACGMPLALVWTAIPTMLKMENVETKMIGLFGLAQLPWTAKVLWAPLLDKYAPPFLKRNSKLGWTLLFQVVLTALIAALAFNSAAPGANASESSFLTWVGIVFGISFLIAFAGASQDIVVDAYAVEALEKSEQSIAVGARTAMYRVGYWVAGFISISAAGRFGWQWVFLGVSLLFLPLMPSVLFAPNIKENIPQPKSLGAAVWEPLVEFAKRPSALNIIAFLILYKFADNLAQALTRPFLVEMKFSADDVGTVSGALGLVGMVAGTFLGGYLTQPLGVGRALWIFGFLQAVSNLGYAAIAVVGPDRLTMYAAVLFENLSSGVGTGAFGVLLLRLTQKRFSATQYALLSSIFAVGRTGTTVLSGFLVEALGWTLFFVLTVFTAIPGLLMLHRFVPFGSKDIPAEAEGEGPESQPHAFGQPVTKTALMTRAGLTGLVGGVLAALFLSLLAALKLVRGGKPFDFLAAVSATLKFETPSSAIDFASALMFGLVVAGFTGAFVFARRGLRPAS